MELLTYHVSLVFGLISFLTVFTFYKAIQNSKGFAFMALFWLVIQSAVSFSGFYTFADSLFTRFLMIILPPALLVIWLFSSQSGKSCLYNVDMHLLTVIHIVRAPVEVVLYLLFISNVVPQEMTIAGGNFDILSGLSAPVIYYWGMMQRKIKWQLLVVWNVACLGMLLNVMIRSVLSAPFFFQPIATDQPEVALLHFPFIFLPGAVLPVILCSHLAMIRNLVKAYWNEPAQMETGKAYASQFLAK